MRHLFAAGTLALALCTTATHAQSDRTGTWDAGVQLLDLSSVFVEGQNGSSLSVDDEIGWGFTGAYNFNERLALGLDLSWSSPSYVATLVPDGIGPDQTVRADLDVNVIHVKGIFYILENDLTPYVELGAGWTYVDSNIVEDVSFPVCWWDPWYGYICSSYYDTYTDTRTSYSYAFGVRWDIDANMMIKAAWGQMEIDTSQASEDIELDTIQFAFAWRF